MSRVYSLGSWLSSSMAVALLAISLILVPQSRSLADTGDGPNAPLKCVRNANFNCNQSCDGQGAPCNKPNYICTKVGADCNGCACLLDTDGLCRCLLQDP